MRGTWSGKVFTPDAFQPEDVLEYGFCCPGCDYVSSHEDEASRDRAMARHLGDFPSHRAGYPEDYR